MAFRHNTLPLIACLILASTQLVYSTSNDLQALNDTANKPTAAVLVQTTSGLLNGTKQALNIGNSSIYKFLAVPYALPPTGQLRFKRPVELPADRANSLIDTSKHGSTCPQYRHLARFVSTLLNLDSEHQTSEDCLHLNIYVPTWIGNLVDENKLEPSKQVPVIVWIPGEGFDFADARQFDGSYLAQQTQSIVVTVQYRVGVLGFLDAPHLAIYGNMGIHDQIMALKWVKNNIHSFGGDPERVTVMGRFSGSMTISAMLTAPKEDSIKLDGRPLFNRAVLLSGVAVEDWIIEDNQSEKFEQLLDQAFKQDLCTKSQILNGSCLQSLPIDKLMAISGFGWKLVVDDELIGRGGPISAIKKNHTISGVDAVLLGETATEGTLCLYRHMLNNENDYAQMIADDRLTSKSLNEIIEDDSLTYFKYNITESNPMRMALQAIVEGNMLEGPNESDSNLRDKYLDACSSYMVKAHANRFKRNLLAKNLELEKSFNKKPVEVFHYELKYKPTFSLAPDYIKTAAHGDDVPLIFGLVYTQAKQNINEADLLMTRKMVSYIGNFVHGNHPLLQQHLPINSKQQSNDLQNETTNMDETDGHQIGYHSEPSMSNRRNGWLAGEHLYRIDLNEKEHNDLNRMVNKQLKSSFLLESESVDQMDSIRGAKSMLQSSKPSMAQDQESSSKSANLRMILMESPQMVELKAVSQANVFEQSRQAMTRSQRLLELHRQQLDDNYLLIQPHRHQLVAVPQISADIVQSTISLSQSEGRNFIDHHHNQQQHLAPTEAHNQAGVVVGNLNTPDTHLMSAMLIGACVVIFALTSFCIVLSLIVFRYNIISRSSNMERKRHFNSSSSTCNICDDSQRTHTSIDTVLGGGNHACNQSNPKKDNHGFRNVFAKLRHHTDSSMDSHHHQQQTTTTTTMCHPDQHHMHRPTNANNITSSSG